MKVYSKIEIDALKEFFNIGIGKAASVLNAMIDSHVELIATEIAILFRKDIDEMSEYDKTNTFSVVEMGYSGNIDGTSCMLISKTDSLKLVKTITGEMEIETSDELNAIRMGTLSEIGNIILNSILGMISNMLNMELTYTVPKYRENTVAGIYSTVMEENKEEKTIIKIGSTFVLKDLSIDGNIIVFLSVDAFTKLNKIIKEYVRRI